MLPVHETLEYNIVIKGNLVEVKQPLNKPCFGGHVTWESANALIFFHIPWILLLDWTTRMYGKLGTAVGDEWQLLCYHAILMSDL